MAETASTYQAKIDVLNNQIGDLQEKMAVIQTPNYYNIRSIVDLLANNHLNDGHHWYHTDTQQTITGPPAEQEYQRWVPWLASQDQLVQSYQKKITSLGLQVTGLQKLMQGDPTIANAQQKALAEINFAQANTKYLIIGAVVIVVIIVGAVIIFKFRRKQTPAAA